MTRNYVHGTHPEEQQRLADLDALLDRGSLAACRFAVGWAEGVKP
jgi:hypothetical protein